MSQRFSALKSTHTGTFSAPLKTRRRAFAKGCCLPRSIACRNPPRSAPSREEQRASTAPDVLATPLAATALLRFTQTGKGFVGTGVNGEFMNDPVSITLLKYYKDLCTSQLILYKDNNNEFF